VRLAGLLLGLGLVVVGAGRAVAHDLSPDQIANVRFDQRLGQRVPPDLLFRDEDGNPVRLGDYFQAQRGPVILSLNYFHCQNLCPLELDGLINGLNGVSFGLGRDFTLVTVSIDPREGPADAAAIKARTLRGYDKPGGAGGWHVLTGDQAAIDRLTDAVGFQYVYDPQQDDFAHPAGVVVLTPVGQISRYLYGLDFSANDLRLAMVDASAQRIGSLVDRALLVCYHYDPLTGRYTLFALNFVRAAAALGALGLVGFLGWLWRGELRARRRTPGASARGSAPGAVG
jgi:protein SCO1/2